MTPFVFMILGAQVSPNIPQSWLVNGMCCAGYTGHREVQEPATGHTGQTSQNSARKSVILGTSRGFFQAFHAFLLGAPPSVHDVPPRAKAHKEESGSKEESSRTRDVIQARVHRRGTSCQLVGLSVRFRSDADDWFLTGVQWRLQLWLICIHLYTWLRDIKRFKPQTHLFSDSYKCLRAFSLINSCSFGGNGVNRSRKQWTKTQSQWLEWRRFLHPCNVQNMPCLH